MTGEVTPWNAGTQTGARPSKQGARPSLAEIAGAAGVSQATVSRVLRNKPNVSAAAQRAVQVALATLGMTTSPSEVPKLAVVQRAPSPAEVDPFERFGLEIVRRAAASGAVCLRCYLDSAWQCDAESLRQVGAAGVIALGDGRPAQLAYELAAAGLPTTLVAATGAGSGLSAGLADEPDRQPTRFELEDGRGVLTALRHLVQLGHVRIGLAAAAGESTASVVAEFRSGLAAGLHIVASRDQAPVAVSEPTLVAGARAAETLLDAGCTAVISCAPALTFGMLEALRRRSLRVPEHLSLLTVGEMPDADLLAPPMSQVAYDWPLLAAEVVHGFVTSGAAAHGPAPVYRITPDLILRGSEAPLRRR